jgi:hypothetical protein
MWSELEGVRRDMAMNDEEMEANKDEIMNVLDEQNEEDYNAKLNEAAKTPFKRDETTKHSLKISPTRFKRIFGHE